MLDRIDSDTETNESYSEKRLFSFFEEDESSFIEPESVSGLPVVTDVSQQEMRSYYF